MPYAHSRAGSDLHQWQPLDTQLKNTAELAENFAAAFARGSGRLAGLWHDAGKCQKKFQHKSVGAAPASMMKRFPLAFAIAGHHDGMKDKRPCSTFCESESVCSIKRAETGCRVGWRRCGASLSGVAGCIVLPRGQSGSGRGSSSRRWWMRILWIQSDTTLMGRSAISAVSTRSRN